MHTGVPDPLELAAQAAAGALDDPMVRRWLQGGLQAWLRGAGVPLERCLRLAPTPKALKRARRDLHLCEAAKALLTERREATATDLHREIRRFARVFWPRWSELDVSPPGTSMLRTALFAAFKAGDAREVQSLGERQLRRLVGHEFRSQCPRDAGTVAASHAAFHPDGHHHP